MADKLIVQLPELEDFPAEQRNPAVELLLGICRRQQEEIVELRDQVKKQAEQLQVQSEQIAHQAEQIECLKDEIARLKGEKRPPKIKPSTLNSGFGGDSGGGQRKRGKPVFRKTCQKLGVSFCDYLYDRLSQQNLIPQLSQLMRQAAAVV